MVGHPASSFPPEAFTLQEHRKPKALKLRLSSEWGYCAVFGATRRLHAGCAQWLDRAAQITGNVLATDTDKFEGTGHILPLALDATSALKALPDNALRKFGRSRVRTYDPSRVKRVLYR